MAKKIVPQEQNIFEFADEQCPYCKGQPSSVSSDGRTECGWCKPKEPAR